MMADSRFTVSERALVARINRKVTKNGEQLRRARGFRHGGVWHADTNLGRYYIVDVNRNGIVAQRVDLEELGRELQALTPDERLEAE